MSCFYLCIQFIPIMSCFYLPFENKISLPYWKNHLLEQRTIRIMEEFHVQLKSIRHGERSICSTIVKGSIYKICPLKFVGGSNANNIQISRNEPKMEIMNIQSCNFIFFSSLIISESHFHHLCLMPIQRLLRDVMQLIFHLFNIFNARAPNPLFENKS